MSTNSRDQSDMSHAPTIEQTNRLVIALTRDDHLISSGDPTILNHAAFRLARGNSEDVAAHKSMVEG